MPYMSICAPSTGQNISLGDMVREYGGVVGEGPISSESCTTDRPGEGGCKNSIQHLNRGIMTSPPTPSEGCYIPPLSLPSS